MIIKSQNLYLQNHTKIIIAFGTFGNVENLVSNTSNHTPRYVFAPEFGTWIIFQDKQ